MTTPILYNITGTYNTGNNNINLQVTSNSNVIVTPPPTNNLSKELQTLCKNIKVLIKGTSPYYVYLLADDQTKLFETEESSDPNDWFGSSCIIGLEDRGLPYDNKGHGEGTFRIWYSKGQNAENNPNNMWFVEVWLGGVYPKSLYLLNTVTGLWIDILDYAAGGQWAIYKEVYPDGHFD
jgi:hypothetical protein